MCFISRLSLLYVYSICRDSGNEAKKYYYSVPSRKLRSKLYGHMLINSCTALLGFYLSFVAASLKSRVPLSDVICGIFSALLHYFMLVYFFWTAAESVLLYLKLVKVFGTHTTNYALKATIVSWSKLYSSHEV